MSHLPPPHTPRPHSLTVNQPLFAKVDEPSLSMQYKAMAPVPVTMALDGLPYSDFIVFRDRFICCCLFYFVLLLLFL